MINRNILFLIMVLMIFGSINSNNLEVETPTVFPGDTIFEAPFKATIKVPESTFVYYGTEGTDIIDYTTQYITGRSLPIDSTTILKVVAVCYTYPYPALTSDTVIVKYTQKIRSPKIKWFEKLTRVYEFYDSTKLEFLCRTGEKIYYTTDGSDPDTTKTFYTGPFWIYETTEIRAFGTRINSINSDTAIYTVEKIGTNVKKSKTIALFSSHDINKSSTYLLNGKLSKDNEYKGISIKNNFKSLNIGTKSKLR